MLRVSRDGSWEGVNDLRNSGIESDVLRRLAQDLSGCSVEVRIIIIFVFNVKELYKSWDDYQGQAG